jgi:hypothetical protein
MLLIRRNPSISLRTHMETSGIRRVEVHPAKYASIADKVDIQLRHALRNMFFMPTSRKGTRQTTILQKRINLATVRKTQIRK